MKPYNSYDKANDDQLRKLRLERFKMLKIQQQIFEKLIASDFDFTTESAKKHIFQGIPSRYRNTVWIQLSRNPHGITKQYYNLLLRKMAKLDPNQIQVPSKISSLSLIKNDVNRTFGQLKIFTKNQQLSTTLQQLLSAWVVFRPDIGYIQGMSSLAGFLLTQLQDFEAFTIFSSILTSDTLFNYYSFDMKQIQLLQKQYQSRLLKQDQKLFYLLEDFNIECRIYLFQWIITLFTRCMQFQTAARIWDILLCEQINKQLVIKIACGLVIMQRETLFELQRDQVIKHLKGLKINYLKQDHLLNYIFKEK